MFGISQVTFLDKLLFTRHLAVMIKSGIPISEAVQSIAEQTDNKTFRKILINISSDIDNGQSLEKALSKYSRVFDAFYLNLVRIGEKSGNLEENLEYLGVSLKKDYDFKQKVIASSIYPTVVLLTAIVVGGGISIFVLPKLIDLFSSLDTNLPTSTKILLWLAETMKSYGILIFGAIIAFLVIFRLILLIKPVRFVWQKFILRFPAVGPFAKNVQMTFFCRNLGIMLKSGMSILESLSSLASSTENLVYKDYVNRFSKSIEKGKSISETIKGGGFGLMPKISVKMIEIGEKTGKLDESLVYLGDFFEDETDTAAKNFINILEPVLLLVIGFIVAFVAMAIISPIYQYTGSIGK
jgi:type II secretory pathway component PulF